MCQLCLRHRRASNRGGCCHRPFGFDLIQLYFKQLLLTRLLLYYCNQHDANTSLICVICEWGSSVDETPLWRTFFARMQLGHVTVCAGNTGNTGNRAVGHECRHCRQAVIYQTSIITVIKQLQLTGTRWLTCSSSWATTITNRTTWLVRKHHLVTVPEGPTDDGAWRTLKCEKTPAGGGGRGWKESRATMLFAVILSRERDVLCASLKTLSSHSCVPEELFSETGESPYIFMGCSQFQFLLLSKLETVLPILMSS